MLAAIGGVSLKHWYHAPEFFWRARLALQQARGDALCYHAEVFPRDGIYFSLSVWKDAEAMLTFAYSGPQRRLIQVSPRLAHAFHFYHFSCIAIPSADQAWQMWRQRLNAVE